MAAGPVPGRPYSAKTRFGLVWGMLVLVLVPVMGSAALAAAAAAADDAHCYLG